MIVPAYATDCIFYPLYVNRNTMFLLLNGTQFARPKKAVRSMQPKHEAAHTTQGGGVRVYPYLFQCLKQLHFQIRMARKNSHKVETSFPRSHWPHIETLYTLIVVYLPKLSDEIQFIIKNTNLA